MITEEKRLTKMYKKNSGLVAKTKVSTYKKANK